MAWTVQHHRHGALDASVGVAFIAAFTVAMAGAFALVAYDLAAGHTGPPTEAAKWTDPSFRVSGWDDRIEVTYQSGPALEAEEVAVYVENRLVDDGDARFWVFDVARPEPATWDVGDRASLVPTPGHVDPEGDWHVTVLVRGKVVQSTVLFVY